MPIYLKCCRVNSRFKFYRETESEYFFRFNFPPLAFASAFSFLLSLLVESAEIGVLSFELSANLENSDLFKVNKELLIKATDYRI